MTSTTACATQTRELLLSRPQQHTHTCHHYCRATPNSNCSWISGDAVFLTRTTSAAGTQDYSAADPGTLNRRGSWEFYCGAGRGDEVAGEERDEHNLKERGDHNEGTGRGASTGTGGSGRDGTEAKGGYEGGGCWTPDVTKARPIMTWRGRVGTVTVSREGLKNTPKESTKRICRHCIPLCAPSEQLWN